MAKIMKRGSRGFTLIEILIVLAVLAVLVAIVVPNVAGFIGRGGKRALDSDAKTIGLAVSAFKTDVHAGVDSNQWGKGSTGNWYPTEDGKADDLELSTSNYDSDFPSNPRIDKYKAGPGTDGSAGDSEIEDGAVWMGLLVNEPYGTAGNTYNENKYSGSAHPMANEQGQYLKDFPKSASETNTDIDSNHSNGNGYSSGSYTWVVLYNGDVVAAYKGSDGKWYAGYKGVYP